MCEIYPAKVISQLIDQGGYEQAGFETCTKTG